MLITTLGPPSGYTQWGLYLLRIMTDVALVDVDYVTAVEIAGLREAWSQRTRPHLFFFSDCPERQIVDVFVQARAPALVFLEDPEDVVGFIMREREMDWRWAVRLANQCLTTIADFVAEESTLLMHREVASSFADFFGVAAAQFGITLEATHLAEIMRRVDPGGELGPSDEVEAGFLALWPHARPRGQALEGLSAADERAIAPLLRTLREMSEGRLPTRVHWPLEMFIPGGRPDDSVDGPIDLLGPARCLVYGPYLSLPQGLWELEVELEVAENLSGNRLEVDIFHGTVLVANNFALPAAGRFSVRASFDVFEPREPVQLRISTWEGAIEGILELRGTHLVRIGEAVTPP
ncbi:hypothetical protein EYW49_06610 [Siculibacillus lacustris]|uniref:Uncharacterized protein n=1 Tax=Siculibacillus lacustris TaxID=1549641 RepID=A0A4Q9VWQ8_9HYPH|nr:hypothetical protein [Siculibacillus lacustris]TBW39535.1 hypothetical protein EYW49_06610 [Siculibacillus lacustris]